jgi:hypothetical protein
MLMKALRLLAPPCAYFAAIAEGSSACRARRPAWLDLVLAAVFRYGHALPERLSPGAGRRGDRREARAQRMLQKVGIT